MLRATIFWGRGIERINQSCKDAGVALPEFKYEHSDLWVVFSFAVQDQIEGSSGKMPVETTQEMSEKTSEKTSEKILLAIKRNKNITIAELAEIASVTTRSIERNIKNLQENGVLKRVGPDKGGHWEILD